MPKPVNPPKPAKSKKATIIDWVPPYPPAQVESDEFQKKEHGGDPDQRIMKDNEQLVRAKVTQEIRVNGAITHRPSEQACIMSAAFAHAHSNAISAPPEVTEE